jgi:hypothetical protein
MPTKKSYDILSKINKHPKDDYIVFEEEKHLYIIDGEKDGWVSVTTLMHQYQEPFDKDGVLTKLMSTDKFKSGEHALSGKTKEEILEVWQLENYRGTALHARMETYMNLTMAIRGDTEPKDKVVRKSVKFSNGDFDVAKQEETGECFSMDKDASKMYLIGYEWKDGSVRRNKEEEAELGVKEPVLEYVESINETKQVLQFWTTNYYLEPYRSEWMIWDKKHKIAGTIDAVFKDTRDGGYWIYDWKRVSSGLEADLEATRYGYKVEETEWLEPVKRWTKKMRGVASELYDTKYWHYCLQLNLYRSILEREYGLKIKGMVLVQFHPNLGDTPNYHRVVMLDNITEKVLEERMKGLVKKSEDSCVDATSGPMEENIVEAGV